MTALRKILIQEETALTTNVARAPAAKFYVVTRNAAPEPEAAPETTHGTLTNIALFLAAPFIGLAYIVALPVVGFAVLAVLAVRALAKYEAVKTFGRMVKNVGTVIAAPVLGLAYVVFFPVIGLAALAYLGGRAVFARAA